MGIKTDTKGIAYKFGVEVYKQRKKKGWSQIQLAKHCKLTESMMGNQISRIELYKGCRLETAVKVCLALDIDLMRIAAGVYGKDGSVNPYEVR